MTIKDFELLSIEKQTELTEYFLRIGDLSGIMHDGKFFGVVKSVDKFTWGQWLTVSDICSETRSDTELMRHLLLVFHFTDLTGKKYKRKTDYVKYLGLSDLFDVFFAMPVAKYYLNIVLDKQKEINKNISLPYTNEQAEAGIHKLEKFGSFGTLRALAGEGQEPSKVLNWNFNDVYLTLWYDTERERVNRNMSNNILNKQK